MGVVYGARDTNLNRPVAVKFLSADLADTGARRRFQREAQMASSLNHPHILTVYAAGEFEGRQYLVTEFVDGGTLRTWGQAEKRSWREVVELLVGVADGLGAAHEAGILHRDVKPENILVARNGYAKLADFGLAKLAEVTPHEATTLTEGRTRQGVIIGSIPYMSPEQASGKPLDARSDIFSFGTVLFEMLAGRRPFEGATSLELLDAIVHRQPPSLAELSSKTPVALRMVVEKALEKDPAERYQSMRELVVDLRRLTRLSGEMAAVKPQPRRGLKLAAALSVFAIVTAVVVNILRNQQSPGSTQLQYIQLTNFTDSAASPALSPDGRMLAFIRGPETFFGPGQIYVKLLPDGEPVQLTNDDFEKMGPQFSPDGARIAYSTGNKNAAGGVANGADKVLTLDTWIVPVLGGQPRRLLTNVEGMTWFRDGARPPRILFSELTGQGGQMSIVSSTESRAELRRVYDPPPPGGMAHRSYLSPDRKWVIVVEMDIRSWLPCRLVPFDASSIGRVVGPLPAQCTDAAWSPDGQWMYFTATTDNGVHIWRQRFPDGTPEQVTFGVVTEEGTHFAPDGRSFVTSVGTSQSTVWVHDSRGERQMTSEGFVFYPSVSPDGKKLYYLVRTYGMRTWYQGGLWVTDLDTAQRQRLLPDFQMQQYSISRDGRRVVFVAADEKGRSPAWVASLNGQTPPRQLTTMDAGQAFFGAPGEVVFASLEEPGGAIYRVEEDGSNLQKIILTPALLPFAVSPDGRWIPVMDPMAWGALMVYPAGDGSPIKLCDLCSPPQGTDPMPSPLSWTPDGKFVYLKFGNSTYAIPLQPGQVLPPMPASGFPSKEAVAAVPGARLVSEQSIYPGPKPSLYAFTKITSQRNIYRIPVP